jgi:hypothetical protein
MMGTQRQILKTFSSLQRGLQLQHSLRGGVYLHSPKGGPTLGSNLWGYHYHLRRQGGGTHHHPRRTYQGEEEMQASNRRRGTSHTLTSAPQ